MKGFTPIEILLIIIIILFLSTLILPLGLDFYKRQQLDTHTQGILQTLRRAQLKAMSVEEGSSFGVYLTNDNYTLFKGDSYLEDDPYNEVFDLPQTITVSGLSEVFFSKYEGKPSSTENIVLNSDSENRTISINNFGMISLLIPAAPSPPSYLAQLHYRWRNDDGGE